MDDGFRLPPPAALAPLALPAALDGGTPAAPAPAMDDARYRTELTAAARKFESFFISQMLKDMRAGTRAMADEGSVFKDPINSDMQGLADGLVADQMAGQHAFGIADVILRQLLPVPDAQVTPAALSPFNAGARPVARQGS